jgi:hypothetical protein
MKNRRVAEPAHGLTWHDELRVLRSQIGDVERDAQRMSPFARGTVEGAVFPAVAQLAAAVSALLGAEIARAGRETTVNSEAAALNEIQTVLSGRRWDADTLCAVAEVVRRTGREIVDGEAT